MYDYEKSALERIAEKLREKYRKKIIAVYAFGSRVRGDHDERSDFDVLVVVKDRDPFIEKGIIDIFVEEENESGLSFAPVIKDAGSFERERDYNTPFYQNIQKEGMAI
jgi:predicted nucleotidyltransferase